MHSSTDKELMFQVKDGDLGKLGILFERHHKILYNFFLRLTGNRQASEDLLQEVFLRMLKYRNTYKGSSEFTTWMFQIARNSRADYFRKKKFESADDEPEDLISRDLIVSEHFEKEQEAKLLHRALSKLPEEDREVLVLSRFQNVKYREIAQIFGCLEGTIKARVHRAMQRLRDNFFELSGERAS